MNYAEMVEVVAAELDKYTSTPPDSCRYLSTKIVDSLLNQIFAAVASGRTVSLRKICTLSPTIKEARRRFNVHKDKHELQPARVSVKLRLMTPLNDRLRERGVQ